MTAQITWLASYPKSGNTWVRALLSNYVRAVNAPADINALSSSLASSRSAFDLVTGIDASVLTADEIDEIRPALYRALARERSSELFMKVHDAYNHNRLGEPLFPSDVTRCAIYIVRNPLDVSVSFAHHLGWPLGRAVAAMSAETFRLASDTGRLEDQLRQQLRSWSGHVRSWLEDTPFRVGIVRYEDLVGAPVETFTQIVQALGFPIDGARIHWAIESSRFERLQSQERENGFVERSPASKVFFRRGQVGDWRHVLDSEDVKRLLDDHGPVMQRLGYLSATGELQC